MDTTNTANTNANNINIAFGMPFAAAPSQQYPFILRAIYFLLVGFWLSLLWVLVAWLIAITVIGLPVAQWMFLRTNGVLTLQKFK